MVIRKYLMVRFFVFSFSFAKLIVIWRYIFLTQWESCYYILYEPSSIHIETSLKWWKMDWNVRILFVLYRWRKSCTRFSHAKEIFSTEDDWLNYYRKILRPFSKLTMKYRSEWQHLTGLKRSDNGIFGMKKCDLNNDSMNDELMGVEHLRIGFLCNSHIH